MILMFWNKFINSYCDFAWIFRISRLCFQKSVPRFSLHKFLVWNWQFWTSFSTSTSWRKKLARRTLRGSKVVSSDLVVEPLVEMMKRVNPVMMWRTLMLTWVVQGAKTGHRFENALTLLIILYLSKDYQLWLLYSQRDHGYISRFQKKSIIGSTLLVGGFKSL